jgi:hypothetical protein
LEIGVFGRKMGKIGFVLHNLLIISYVRIRRDSFSVLSDLGFFDWLGQSFKGAEVQRHKVYKMTKVTKVPKVN